MKAYAVTSYQYNNTHVVAIRSTKDLAIQACEAIVGSYVVWDYKEKLTGSCHAQGITASYQRFTVDEELKNTP